MNLRDQFLKAGLVDKKRADQVAREAKKEQKIAQGQQVDKATLARQEAERIARERAEREAEVARKRAEAEAREAEHRRTQGVAASARAILRQNRVPVRGGTQRFYYRSPDGKQAWKLMVPEWMATDLRCGRLCIAWCDDPEGAVVIDALTANRVEKIRPELVLFRNRGGIDTRDEEQLYED